MSQRVAYKCEEIGDEGKRCNGSICSKCKCYPCHQILGTVKQLSWWEKKLHKRAGRKS